MKKGKKLKRERKMAEKETKKVRNEQKRFLKID